jgi:hypothetical protein
MPGHVEFLLDRVALRQALLPVLRFSPVSIIPSLIRTDSLTYHRCFLMLAIDSVVKQGTF